MDTKLGILGGTFNPVHVGHLVMAQLALEHFELSRVLLVPCAIPPHKSARNLIEARHRLSMLEAVADCNPCFQVSDVELRRPGRSYAVDTVKALSLEYPHATLFFVIGTDTLTELHKWRQIYDLLPLCRFVSFERPGYELARIHPGDIALEHPWPERLLKDAVTGVPLNISSTDIRYRVAEGLSIRYLVPPEVDMYIAEHRLYQG